MSQHIKEHQTHTYVDGNITRMSQQGRYSDSWLYQFIDVSNMFLWSIKLVFIEVHIPIQESERSILFSLSILFCRTVPTVCYFLFSLYYLYYNVMLSIHFAKIVARIYCLTMHQ